MSLQTILEGDKGRAPTKLKWKGIPGRRAAVGKCPLTSGHQLGVRDTKDKCIGGRAKRTSLSVELKTGAKVIGSGVVQALMTQRSQFERNPVLDGKPVKRSQQRGDVICLLLPQDKSCSAVLDTLQALKGGSWDSSQKRIAVIKAREDERDNQLNASLPGQITTDGGDAYIKNNMNKKTSELQYFKCKCEKGSMDNLYQ